MTELIVISKKENHVGWIMLNRPRVLNSLNADMVKIIYEQLQEWREDDSVALVCISGNGDKGLCAGGDMKRLHDLRNNHVEEEAYQFFSVEYLMDLLIYHYAKPVLVYMNGIVMGGGVGLSYGASHRIVNEKTKWAMPEMNIGFYPDVGASYFLNEMPGNIGKYLALTSQVIRAEDVLYINAADLFIKSENWPKLTEEIIRTSWSGNVQAELDRLLANYKDPVDPAVSKLAQEEEKINKHFAYETVEEILASLEKDAEKGDSWAAKTRKILLQKAPLSLKVTLQQLEKGKNMTLADSFKMEFALSMNFMNNPDFYEGVRSVLVDKDRNPQWKLSKLEDISKEKVLSYFESKEEWQNVLEQLDEVPNLAQIK